MKPPAKLWRCPRCKRRFEKKNQGHSCNLCPLEKHFERKQKAKALFAALTAAMMRKIGPFRIESLPCCIHFVSTYTFAAAFAMTDRLRVSFSLPKKERNTRLRGPVHVSKNKFQYAVDVTDPGEIDAELLAWLRQAYKTRD